MQRRDFIRKAGTGMGLSAGVLAVPTAIAAQAGNSEMLEKGQDFAQELARESLEKMRNRLKEAENKIDQLQTNQKKTIKAAVIVTGLVVGLDLSLLI